MTPSPISTSSLSLHPDVKHFPFLGEDEMGALTISIKERGILVPLFIDEEQRVYDGRARLAIAETLGLTTVPVIVREEKDVLAFAIETRVNRGQLTRSGIAMLIFEQHPELAARRGKVGRPNKCSSGEQLSATHDSYRSLGVRYRVPYQYFSNLGEMRAGMSDEEWMHLRHIVLYEEASIPRQYAGFRTGLPAGSQRGAVIYAAMVDGELEGIFPRALASLREGFSRWDSDIRTDAKAAIEREWEALLDDAPAELVKIAIKKAGRRG